MVVFVRVLEKRIKSVLRRTSWYMQRRNVETAMKQRFVRAPVTPVARPLGQLRIRRVSRTSGWTAIAGTSSELVLCSNASLDGNVAHQVTVRSLRRKTLLTRPRASPDDKLV